MSNILRLTITAALPVLASVLLSGALHRTRQGDTTADQPTDTSPDQGKPSRHPSCWHTQTLAGLVFGGVAVIGTELGTDVGGAVVNARDAAPLCAGLLFGGPAGILAGLIGGVERWFSVYWGVGSYTRLACTLATILAGFFAAALRCYLLEDKRPSWYYGLFAGVVMEVLHMLLIFLTNMSDIARVFAFVESCTLPMILLNSLSVTLAVFLVELMDRNRKAHCSSQKNLSQTFQCWLALVMTAAFLVTSLFNWTLQTRLARENAQTLLALNLADVRRELRDAWGREQAGGSSELSVLIPEITRNRHVGGDGSILVADRDGKILWGPRGNEGELVELSGLWTGTPPSPGTYFTARVFGTVSYCTCDTWEGYYILAALPWTEVYVLRNVSVYLTVFMETVLFAVLFVLVYFLIKKLIVENIRRINESLDQIAGGNLDVTVDVRANAEFSALSDDINATVTTLKRYIAEAAARIDQELEYAREIQLSVMPRVYPPFPHRKEFDIYATMCAAKEVGGDFYDFYLLGENRLAFLIADVSGKGIPAAMFMMTARTLIKSLAESGLEPDEVFTQANEQLCAGNDAGMFVTAWMGILKLGSGQVTFVNAGHNPPVVISADGTARFLKTRPGFVLAGMEGIRYEKKVVGLAPGDRLYLYTDGVTEAMDSGQELYGEDRLLALLTAQACLGVQKLCQAVLEDIARFVGDGAQFDDITMVGLEVRGTGGVSHQSPGG